MSRRLKGIDVCPTARIRRVSVNSEWITVDIMLHRWSNRSPATFVWLVVPFAPSRDSQSLETNLKSIFMQNAKFYHLIISILNNKALSSHVCHIEATSALSAKAICSSYLNWGSPKHKVSGAWLRIATCEKPKFSVYQSHGFIGPEWWYICIRESVRSKDWVPRHYNCDVIGIACQKLKQWISTSFLPPSRKLHGSFN